MAQNTLLKARKDGYNEAARELRQQIFDYLETLYMDEDLERGSERAVAILEITQQLSEKLKLK